MIHLEKVTCKNEEDVGQIAKIVIPDYHRNGLLTDRNLSGQ